jgi:predicted GNAT family N-acyltransferase
MAALHQIFPITIELLDKGRHDRTSFDCGVPALNTYLQRQATQDVDKRAAIVYVAVIEPPTIVGYYTLSQFSIELMRLPEALAKRLARYPVVSATLLGRLAVASEWQGQKLGKTLLFDALQRSLAQSVHIASAGVVVDAKDEQASAFYRRYGFSSVLGAEHRLILHMKDIQRMF